MATDYLSLQEVCRFLGKSKRTVSRYIKKGLLNPERIKNEKGIPEYRFDGFKVDSLKN